MLYAWIGFLKPEANSIPASLQESATDFLRQPLIHIRAAGPPPAETFVADSPYVKADMYEDHRLYEYANEVG
jgi:hypothetical protein